MHLQSLLALLSLAAASPVLLPKKAPKVLHFDTTICDISGQLDKRDAFKESLLTSEDTRMTIPLYIGSENTEVHVCLDTCSYYTWIPSTTDYYLSQSSTSKNLSTTFSSAYIGKSVSGWNVQDYVAPSADGSDAVSIGFGITSGSSLFNVDTLGLLGLSKNPTAGNSFVVGLKTAGYIETQSYGLWLSDNSNGSITFGGVDTTKMAEDFTILPLNSGSGIYVQKFKATLNNEEIVLAEGNKYTCALDTGSPTTTFPNAMADAFFKAFNGVYTSNSPEALAAGMPKTMYALKYPRGGSLKLESCGYEFEIPLWRYLCNKSYQIFTSEPEEGTWCLFNIAKKDYCLLGMNEVFKEYVIAFDFDKNVVGMAANNKDYTNDSGSSSLSEIGTDGLAGQYAPSTQLTTTGTAFTGYSGTTFTNTATA